MVQVNWCFSFDGLRRVTTFPFQTPAYSGATICRHELLSFSSAGDMSFPIRRFLLYSVISYPFSDHWFFPLGADSTPNSFLEVCCGPPRCFLHFLKGACAAGTWEVSPPMPLCGLVRLPVCSLSPHQIRGTGCRPPSWLAEGQGRFLTQKSRLFISCCVRYLRKQHRQPGLMTVFISRGLPPIRYRKFFSTFAGAGLFVHLLVIFPTPPTSPGAPLV